MISTLMLVAQPAFAQQLEMLPRPQGETKPAPYLPTREIRFDFLLPAPPSPGSPTDDADVARVMAYQQVSGDRFASAVEDERLVFPRFDIAFGSAVRRETAPVLVRILNRTIRDIAAVAFPAKERFRRPRPYQRVQLKLMCGADVAPLPEPNPTGGSSYPSGHSAYGWATAMVLARVRPERADALMARAMEYAESRVICGMHFPSDIAAGQVVAAAVLSRLDADAAFKSDLAAARRENDAGHQAPK